ncbi:MAG TPA: Flp family type IVb pilin [Micromonosporaceae bacterium]|jgi:pilus assembly protein Flp/PilA|nr:Flp family type IVb pilin [Micromonosporaceae bacterium]
MIRLISKLQALRTNSERGATAVEYGLMVALIAAVIVVSVGLLGGALDTKFTQIVTAVTGAGGGA